MQIWGHRQESCSLFGKQVFFQLCFCTEMFSSREFRLLFKKKGCNPWEWVVFSSVCTRKDTCPCLSRRKSNGNRKKTWNWKAWQNISVCPGCCCKWEQREHQEREKRKRKASYPGTLHYFLLHPGESYHGTFVVERLSNPCCNWCCIDWCCSRMM